jgi:hypothetical protein
MDIMLRDFQPINNNWTPDEEGQKYCCSVSVKWRHLAGKD